VLGLIGRRVLAAIPNVIGIVVVTFILTRALPGDPAAFYAGPAATQEAVEQIRTKLGLDQPLWRQFIDYLGDLSRGDLGLSLSTGQQVLDEILRRLPASLELTLIGLLVACVVALPLGILASTRPGSWIDHACRLVTTLGVSLPIFFTGLLLAYVFYYLLGIAPPPVGRLDSMFSPPPHVTGFFLVDSLLIGDLALFRAAASQMVLPVLTLAIFVLAPIARMTRASMLGVLSSDFVRTARASGLSSGTVLYKYAFRNAMLPVVTTMGMVFSFMLGSNVVIEKVFAWPGIGSFAVDALMQSDYAPVQGFVLVMALLFVSLNLMIDILYTVIDPRVSMDE